MFITATIEDFFYKGHHFDRYEATIDIEENDLNRSKCKKEIIEKLTRGIDNIYEHYYKKD